MRTRLLAIGLAIASALLGLATVAPAPVGATDLQPWPSASDFSPKTWVDGSGRQYTIAVLRNQTGPVLTVVARDTPDGDPDPTWGSLPGHPGFRSITLTKPASGTTMESGIGTGAAATSAGTTGLPMASVPSA